MRAQRLSGVVFLAFLLAIVCGVASAGATEASFAKPAPNASALACMRFLPDGAPVCIHNKSIIGITNSDVYVAEPDRSAGMRINTAESGIPAHIVPGALMSCQGTMATENGDRYITDINNLTFTTVSGPRIGSLAMASPAIMGLPIDPKFPDGPRVTGLLPTSQLVTIWGKVTAKALSDNEGYWFIYLDDGWGKKDGNELGCTGIRVYCDTVPADNEPLQVATGMLTMKQIDPTPFGPDGDEVIIPTIRTTFPSDVCPPHTQPVTQPRAPVSGRVRLVGQNSPGVPVRVYSGYGDLIIDRVTDTWEGFTIDSIRVNGGVITASAPGYLSETVNACGGDTGIDIELQPSQKYIEVISSPSSIAVCSAETAPIVVLCRDYEGKGVAGQQLRLTTTLGEFAESHTNQLLVTTDSSGCAESTIITGQDGAGTAFVAVSDYPDENHSTFAEVRFVGPQITLAASQYCLNNPGYSSIKATVTSNGAGVAGQVLTFKTSAGVFQQTDQPSAVVVTDDTGEAQVGLSLMSPGTALVTASYTNQCSQNTISWLAVSCGTAPWYDQGVSYSNPLVADLDGFPDGKKETALVTSSGAMVALDASGAPLWTISTHPDGNNTFACAKLDALRSEKPALFIPSESQQKVCAYTHDGQPLAGWPTTTDFVTHKASVAIGDLNLDGTEEITVGDQCCYVFSWNSTGDWKGTEKSGDSFLWRNLTGTPNTAIFGSSCAIGDLNGDPQGIPDVAIGTNHGPEAYAFPGDAWGDFIYNPYYLDGWPRATGGRVESSPALGDIDGDGRNDYAMGSDTQAVSLWLSSDNSWKSYSTEGIVRSSPALCDLDKDGKLDIIVGSNDGRVYAFNWHGQAVDGWSGGITLNCTDIYPVESSPVVGDINGDGQVEVVVGCNDGNVYGLYGDGRNHTLNGEMTGPIAWVGSCVPPGSTSAKVVSAPVIDDMDNDGMVDILAAGSMGVYLFHLDAPYSDDSALYPWPTFHRDNKRTGCATPPPAPVNASIQGIVTKDGIPVTQAKVYIYGNDGSTVYQPHSDPPAPRGFVLTVGSSDPNEGARGSYCISQLEPNKTYKIKVEAAGLPTHWINDVAVTTGLVRIDVEM